MTRLVEGFVQIKTIAFLFKMIYFVCAIESTFKGKIMRFVNIRELSKSPSKYMKSANEESDLIVTRNGLPYVVISRIDGSELEDYILAKHFGLEEEFQRAVKEYESGETINADNLLAQVEQNS